MRRSLPFLLALALPAQAHAAALTEAQFTRVNDILSFCTTATGGPGEVIEAVDETTRIGSSVRLYQATPAGFTAGRPVRLAHQLDGCPVGATRADGASIVAAPAMAADQGHSELAYAIKPPGGSFGPPAQVAVLGDGIVQRAAVAINDAATPAVLWTEARDAGKDVGYVVRAVVDSTVQTVADTGAANAPVVRVGIAADGEAVAMWAFIRGTEQVVQAATAAPGGTFGPPQTVGEASALSTPALAVADDGSALAVLPQLDSLSVAERPPGGAFGAPAKITAATDPTAISTAAALDATGAAAVAWVGYGDGQAGVVTRAPAGAFGPAHILAPPRPPRLGDRFFDSEAYFLPTATTGVLHRRGDPSVALTQTGAQVVWKAGNQVRVGDVAMAGGDARTQTLGGGLRTPTVVAQLALPGDAEPAVAWVDESRDSIDDDHIHLAIGNGAAPRQPAPRLTIGAPVKRRLDLGDSLTLRVRCSAPCEARAQTAHDGDGTLTLRKAGAGRIDIYSPSRTLAPARTRSVKVTFSYGPPGAPRPRTKTAAVRLTGVPLPRTPRVHALEATRSGDVVTVGWRVDHPTSYAGYWVTGAASAGGKPLVTRLGGRTTNTRRSFHVRLRGAAGVKVAAVHMIDDATGVTRRANARVVP